MIHINFLLIYNYIIFLSHIIKTALFQGHQIICIKDTCLVWEFFSSSQQPSCFSLSLLSSTNALKNIFDRVTLILYHLVHGQVVEVGCWRSQSKLHRHLCHLQEPTLRQQICYWVLTQYNFHYVLPAVFSDDALEKFFGQARQHSGGTKQ